MISVGLAGYGVSGRIFHTPLILNHGQFQLKKIFSTQEKAAETGAAVVSNYTDLLEDKKISLIVITTPNAEHFPMALQALRSGKHVVVEKPFVIRSEDGETLIAEARKRNLMLTVFHNRRWDRDFLDLQRQVKEGALGDIYHFESHFDRYRPDVNSTRWREKNEPGAGVLYDLGSHLIDQLLLLFGNPDKMSAEVKRERPGALVDDYFHLVFQYNTGRPFNGMKAILHASCMVKEQGPRFAVHGSERSFLSYGLDPQEEALRANIRPQRKTKDDESFWGYLKFYDGVANSMNDPAKIAPPVDAQDAIDAVKIIESCALKS